MASGDTSVASLADSNETIIAQSRMRREFGTVMTRVVDKVTLDSNTGTTWNETVVENLTAQDVDENTNLDNHQQMVDAIISVVPTIIGLSVFFTDRARRRISSKTLAQTGKQPQNAIERRKDIDGLSILDSLTGLGAAGTTITAGHIRAGAAQNRVGGAVEEWDGPQATVLHSYQGKILEDELEAGMGTYPAPNGLSAEVYRTGLKGMVANTELFYDDNMTIDGSGDAKGGTFARGNGGAIVLVQGAASNPKYVRNEFRGGGGEAVVQYDEYKYLIRSDNWGQEMYFDAPTPTS